MHSIRTKFTLLTVIAIIVAISIAMSLCAFSIKDLGRSDADQLLHLMCETGAMNLESYFESVEHSVKTVTTLVQESLEGISIEELGHQVERARHLFGEVAFHTNGVLTYYFRIDPKVSKTVKGFWYVNDAQKGFQEHEVTDISAYDTDDTSVLVWFTVPKATGEGVWLPPYYTDNLGALVISYNMPVYWEGQFVGVIGIEIEYETLAREVENIRLFEHGYAFILDEDGFVIYHPSQELALSEEKRAEYSIRTQMGEKHIEYDFEGIRKEAVWHLLSNGMRLYVSVPVSEINRGWKSLVARILFASLALLGLVSLVTMRFAKRITDPLRQLTLAAKQVDEGNYEFDLKYRDKEDEVGILTHTFGVLAAHTREHIRELSEQVYVDDLTQVLNKRAYGEDLQTMQDQIDENPQKTEFAVGVFDCDNLKRVNDTYGHEKGDLYLKAASRLICQVFRENRVYRIGGDEFAVILQGEDYVKRESLVEGFRGERKRVCEEALHCWEEVNVTLGMAIYEPNMDLTAIDVARRADQRMYENKRLRKGAEGR